MAIIIDWYALLLIGVFTILCSVIVSMIPAHRAGKLKEPLINLTLISGSLN